MPDSFSRETRSRIMRAVKSRGNKSTEIKLARIFRKKGMKGWRRNYKIDGSPDFVFPRQKIAVFADGCFWHGHNCRNVTPKDNSLYWENKIRRNKKRDREVSNSLTQKGWRVFRVFECKIRKERLPEKLIEALRQAPIEPNAF